MYPGVGITGKEVAYLKRRVRAADYLTVAQLFLAKNYLLAEPLSFDDIKSRLLGHWGTCHGINVVYSNFEFFFRKRGTLQFVLGPGHGFPALQANLFLDGELEKVDPKATRDLPGIEYVCKNFSFPGGFPSHSSPLTPTVITEGGELGYALGAAYGAVLGHPEKTVAVLIGDGEFETGSCLASLNFEKLIGGETNGKVIPILHVNGYKISGPTVFGRKSEREQKEMLRGFGFEPIDINGEDPEKFQRLLYEAEMTDNSFILFHSRKGETGPLEVDGQKVAGNYLAHQIPLPLAKSNQEQLEILENWLKSYHFEELFSEKEGFAL